MFKAVHSKNLQYSTLNHEKCALLKNSNLFTANIFVHIHFKLEQKSGIPILPLFTFHPKKWFTAFMEEGWHLKLA
jgi:hypothetical protein